MADVQNPNGPAHRDWYPQKEISLIFAGIIMFPAFIMIFVALCEEANLMDCNWVTAFGYIDNAFTNSATYEEALLRFGTKDFIVSNNKENYVLPDNFEYVTYKECSENVNSTIIAYNGCASLSFCDTCSNVSENAFLMFIIGGVCSLVSWIFIIILGVFDFQIEPLNYGVVCCTVNSMQWIGVYGAFKGWFEFQPCYKELVDWKDECNTSNNWKHTTCVTDDDQGGGTESECTNENLQGCTLAGFIMLSIGALIYGLFNLIEVIIPLVKNRRKRRADSNLVIENENGLEWLEMEQEREMERERERNGKRDKLVVGDIGEVFR